MKAVDTLIRLARMQADACARELRDAEDALAAALGDEDRHAASAATEDAAAAAAPNVAVASPGYALRRSRDRDRFAAETVAAEQRLEQRREDLRAAMVEVRKLERLQTLTAERAAAADRVSEAAAMDEAATLRAARKRPRG